MKQDTKQYTPVLVTLTAGVFGLMLQILRAFAGTDSRGLLPGSHPVNILIPILSAAVLVYLLILSKKLGPQPGYRQLFPASAISAIGCLAAAAGILLAAISELNANRHSVTLITCIVGFLCSACLVYTGWCHYKGRRPSVLFQTVISIYFMLHLLSRYQLWSAESQTQRFAPQLLASCFLMLAGYHRAALGCNAKDRKVFVFCNLAAMFFSCLAILGDAPIFHLSMLVWTATGLCSLDDAQASKLKPIKLPELVLRCIHALEEAGFAAYAVGGCVRDQLLGLTPHDYDLCTNALPGQISQVFSEYPQVHSGEKHGTVGVILDGDLLEITTFRTEGGYSDGRHPDWVDFVTDINEDLRRRDFTVNAMAYSPTRGFADPWGGRKDLHAGILRAVGEPRERFTEDALRILRGVRFAVKYRLTPDADTELAMTELAPSMEQLAKERIFDELCKLLPLVNQEDLLRYAPILVQVIPDLALTVDFCQHSPHHAHDVYTHTAMVTQAVAPELALRWAALLHDIGKPDCFTQDETGRGHFKGHAQKSAQIADEILMRLRAPNALREQVVFLIENHMLPPEADKKLLRRRIAQMGIENYQLLLQLQEADFGGKGVSEGTDTADVFRQIRDLMEQIRQEDSCLSLKDLALNGQDLLDLGFTPGPMVGNCLKHLLEQVLEETLPNDKESLCAAAQAYLRQEEGETL